MYEKEENGKKIKKTFAFTEFFPIENNSNLSKFIEGLEWGQTYNTKTETKENQQNSIDFIIPNSNAVSIDDETSD